MDVKTKHVEILLIEDTPGDVQLVREALREINGLARLHVAQDGQEAMAFLKREGVHTDAPRPDIILLDLNLPKLSGHQVLERIKQDAGLKAIPTIVLSASGVESDIQASYQLRASCYFQKPSQWDDFERIIRGINAFWVKRVTAVEPLHDDPPLDPSR